MSDDLQNVVGSAFRRLTGGKPKPSMAKLQVQHVFQRGEKKRGKPTFKRTKTVVAEFPIAQNSGAGYREPKREASLSSSEWVDPLVLCGVLYGMDVMRNWSPKRLQALLDASKDDPPRERWYRFMEYDAKLRMSEPFARGFVQVARDRLECMRGKKGGLTAEFPNLFTELRLVKIMVKTLHYTRRSW